ncbi:unnamed protein product [Rhizophagus irregularis]|nr:unnamed protein product [Rhizophagus irregularis]
MLFSYFALNRRSWKNKYEKKGRWFINLTRPKLDINAVQAAVPMKYKGFLAPDVAFIPEDIFLSLDEKQLWSFEGQPFTS